MNFDSPIFILRCTYQSLKCVIPICDVAYQLIYHIWRSNGCDHWYHMGIGRLLLEVACSEKSIHSRRVSRINESVSFICRLYSNCLRLHLTKISVKSVSITGMEIANSCVTPLSVFGFKRTQTGRCNVNWLINWSHKQPSEKTIKPSCTYQRPGTGISMCTRVQISRHWQVGFSVAHGVSHTDQSVRH